MVILGPSVLITQYKTVSCCAPQATHLSQVALNLWATFVTIFGLLLTSWLDCPAVLHESRLAGLPAWNGKQKRVMDLLPEIFTKEWGFPNHSFSIQISEKPVAPPLDIPSRSPNRIGAARLGLIKVLFNGHDNSWDCALFEKLKLKINMADLKMNRQRKSKRKDDNSVSFTFYFSFWLNVHWSGQLRDIKVLFEKPFDYDISL